MPRSPVMVMATEFWSGGSGRGLAEGFRALGWGVQEIDWNHYRGRPGADLVMRALARISASKASRLFTDKILETCRTLRPDVFLSFKGFGVTFGLLDQLRALGVTCVMVYPDVDFDHASVDQHTFGHYDLFVTTKRFHLEHLSNRFPDLKVMHCDHGYSGAVHRPWLGRIADQDRRHDVLHVGTHSKYKQIWIDRLEEIVSHLDVTVIGTGWRDAGRSASGERTGIAYAHAIQQARVNVALMYGPTASGWQDSISTRTFEIPACGGFMLHIDNEEVRDLYRVGEEIDVFASVEELADKIDFYLPRADLRDAMIARAYARCVPSYSYDRRAEQIAQRLAVS